MNIKNINGGLVGIAILVAIVTLPIPSEAQQKTPITDVTYSVFQGECQKSCNAAATSDGRLDKNKVLVYCACACMVATSNVHVVVKKYSLHYEEELTSHQAEFMPSVSDITTCKYKSEL